MTLDTWIKLNYGTQGKFNASLGLPQHTVNRWYNHKPKYFLIHLSKICADTNTSVKELIEMVESRDKEVKILESGKS
jgi:hypothetical protein|tara:strand:+ start:1058 stop:1288 length:231 start_codon:yes stop_codon:yes gene_type:complete